MRDAALLIAAVFVSCFSATHAQLPHAHACIAPYDNFTFCDTSLPVQARVDALVALFTLDEKISLMSDGQAAIPRYATV